MKFHLNKSHGYLKKAPAYPNVSINPPAFQYLTQRRKVREELLVSVIFLAQ
jgi:hypothetical protein